jgi:uncharacterized repeat protein (TIGR04138 family)
MRESLALQLAVHEVLQRDPRYAAGAYAFLSQVLGHTVKMVEREDADDRHVNGKELLAGFRDLALQEFGPMAAFIVNDWGVKASEDVGHMVFNLISVGYFGRSETDCLEDFSDGVDMAEALSRPYRVVRSS